jgi:hypothetical protein
MWTYSKIKLVSFGGTLILWWYLHFVTFVELLQNSSFSFHRVDLFGGRKSPTAVKNPPRALEGKGSPGREGGRKGVELYSMREGNGIGLAPQGRGRAMPSIEVTSPPFRALSLGQHPLFLKIINYFTPFFFSTPPQPISKNPRLIFPLPGCARNTEENNDLGTLALAQDPRLIQTRVGGGGGRA